MADQYSPDNQASLAIQVLQMLQGGAGQTPPPPQKDPAQVRMARYQNLINDFSYTLGSGLKEAAQTAGGARRRTQAGVGASLMAPMFLQQAREKMALEKSLEEQRINTSNRANLMLPAQLLAALSNAGKTQAGTVTEEQRPAQVQAQTDLTKAQTGTETTKPALNRSVTDLNNVKAVTEAKRPALVEAQTGAANEATKRSRYYPTADGVFDVDQGKMVTEPGGRVYITQDVINRYGLPKELLGEQMRAADLNSMVNAGREKPDKSIVTLEENGKRGLYEYNFQTQEKTRIGDAPPPNPQSVQAQGGSRVTDNLGNFIGWAFPDGRFVQSPVEGARTGAQSQATLSRNELLQDILSKLDVLETASKRHPGVIGGAYGAVGKGVDFIRQLGLYNDPDVTDIFNLSGDLSDQRLRQRSGAQINEQEMKRITRFSPDPTKQTQSSYFDNIKNMRAEVERMLGTQTVPRAVTPTKSPAPAPTGIPDYIVGPNGQFMPNPAKRGK